MKRDLLIRRVELQLGRKNVKMSDRFIEDLGAESIDILHIVSAIEKQEDIHIPEDIMNQFRTLQDIYNYVNPEQINDQ